ncbi:MAG: hypothetical protein IH803_06700, partial [Nitrospirae bacterium]|nr:hypothetical protein [Nitrospirota bacterium]
TMQDYDKLWEDLKKQSKDSYNLYMRLLEQKKLDIYMGKIIGIHKGEWHIAETKKEVMETFDIPYGAIMVHRIGEEFQDDIRELVLPTSIN